MQPRMHDRATASADQPGLLAPDTSGMNFYRADPALTDLLRIHLPDVLFRHIEPPLDRLGALAGGHLDECARLADRHVPELHQRDRFGRDAQWIEYHPAYRELERNAFGEFGIHAMSVRTGRRPILWWPSTLSRFCSTRPNSGWAARSMSLTVAPSCCRASAVRRWRLNICAG